MPTKVLVPPLGQTVDTVRLDAWYQEEGATVTKGEPLFAIETDKAVLDVEAPASGVLRQVSAQAGDEVEVLSAIALIAAPDEAVEEAAPPAEPAPAAQPAQTPDRAKRDGRRDRGERVFISPRARRLAENHDLPLEVLPATGPEGAIVERDVRAYLETQAEPAITPVARRIAEEAGLDWRNLSGSGPSGRITREDVEQEIEAQTLKVMQRAALPETFRVSNEVRETIPLRSVRATIAERMAHSTATTAPVTLTAEADATALVELRRQLVEDGIAASYNSLFLCVLARALREHPQLNASLDGDTIKLWERIHVGVAVETERGLLVPVVRDVDRKGVGQLSQDLESLIERAKAGQCTPDELTGGTFTLTNLGMFGIDAFTPIINLPECAILGVGRIKRQPVMVGDQVEGREMVWLSLTFDHRLVDGAPAARFLQRVVQFVERPHLLIT